MEREGTPGVHPGRGLQEESLAQVWSQVPRGWCLATQEGERVQVLFPGRQNRGPGPDFRGAFLATETAGHLRGDVELHLYASAWRAHRHDTDPRYNGVILHVVARDDEGAPTLLRNGARVPVAVLRGVPWGMASGRGEQPAGFGVDRPAGRTGCPRLGLFAGAGPEGGLSHQGRGTAQGGPDPPRGLGPGAAPGSAPSEGRSRPMLCCAAGEDIGALLQEQGFLRFQVRAARWRRVPPAGRDEALYRALLEGMGLGGDRRPFGRLARLVPLGRVRQEAPGRGGAGRIRAVQALLLGTAGMLDTAGADRGLPVTLASELREHWASQGEPARLRAETWMGWARRPAASPLRRLLGFGVLAASWGEGPAQGLAMAAGELPAPERASGALRRWLVAGPRGGAMGSARGDILAVNVLLPFLAGAMREDQARWAESAYRLYPALETDVVVREMGRRLGLGRARLAACQQQGLHRLYREYCARGRQEACPIGGGA